MSLLLAIGQRALYLNRDGVINVNCGYVHLTDIFPEIAGLNYQLSPTTKDVIPCFERADLALTMR
jgi:histidinol phosphatase-like enzyme